HPLRSRRPSYRSRRSTRGKSVATSAEILLGATPFPVGLRRSGWEADVEWVATEACSRRNVSRLHRVQRRRGSTAMKTIVDKVRPTRSRRLVVALVLAASFATPAFAGSGMAMADGGQDHHPRSADATFTKWAVRGPTSP